MPYNQSVECPFKKWTHLPISVEITHVPLHLFMARVGFLDLYFTVRTTCLPSVLKCHKVGYTVLFLLYFQYPQPFDDVISISGNSIKLSTIYSFKQSFTTHGMHNIPFHIYFFRQ